MRWAERWQKLNPKPKGCAAKLPAVPPIAQVFNRIARQLKATAIVERTEDGELSLTTGGQALRRIYGERDLLTALCLDAHFDVAVTRRHRRNCAALTLPGQRER